MNLPHYPNSFGGSMLHDEMNLKYSEIEDKTWSMLYDCQLTYVEKYATQVYLDSLIKLRLPQDHIPTLAEVSKRLIDKTGWTIVPATSLVYLKDFFELLADKHFPAATFIRSPNEFNFSVYPDIFHELFGHAPLLINPDYAAFLQRVGIYGCTLNAEQQKMLGRLFWFTIEVGMIRENNNIKIYGAAILSSKAECNYLLNSMSELECEFNLNELLRTLYEYREIQKKYFIIPSFNQLYSLINSQELTEAFNRAINC
ncbi:MAG: phenylalanine-4-hydroxylase [Pseudomonadota bacterium]|nr:phenylalanine-4-hydroxylase [Pseudomonadota bacterium]